MAIEDNFKCFETKRRGKVQKRGNKGSKNFKKKIQKKLQKVLKSEQNNKEIPVLSNIPLI